MQRFIFATLLGLTLIIGMTVGGMAWRTATFERSALDIATADPAIGIAFYVGIDQVLTDGDTSALEDAVTGDFVDHPGDGATSQSIDELTGRLAAFATTFPGARFEVTEIVATGGNLVATIAPVTPPPVTVAGMSMTTQPISGGYDVLRIRNGKVAERWSAGLPALSTASFPAASFSLDSTTNLAIQMTQTELPGDSEVIWHSGRTAVVMVESGTIRVNRSWAQGHEGQNDTVTVQAGGALLISPRMAARLRSANADSARLLTFSIWRVAPVEMPTHTYSGNASSQLLWTSNLPLAQSGKWSVEFGRVQIPERTDVTFQGADEMEVLLCSESSTVQAGAFDGVIESFTTDLTKIEQARKLRLDSDSASHIVEASSIELATDPDAGGIVWVIAISPGGAPATPIP